MHTYIYATTDINCLILLSSDSMPSLEKNGPKLHNRRPEQIFGQELQNRLRSRQSCSPENKLVDPNGGLLQIMACESLEA